MLLQLGGPALGLAMLEGRMKDRPHVRPADQLRKLAILRPDLAPFRLILGDGRRLNLALGVGVLVSERVNLGPLFVGELVDARELGELPTKLGGAQEQLLLEGHCVAS